MASNGYRQWLAAGRPWKLAQPIADLAATLRRHGYTVGTIGNGSHLQANTPEDHTPFSATGWPGPHPRWYVLALDVMPAGGGLPSLAQLGAQLAADRNAGVAGAAWVKYMNWQPANAGVRHEAWDPAHRVVGSTDAGHIHISCRTDYATSGVAGGYDPVARIHDGAVPIVHATTPAGSPTSSGGNHPPGSRVLRVTTPYMTGDDVRFVQRWIGPAHAGPADGIYGPGTAAGVRWYQRLRGIAADGIAGPQTFHQMGIG